MWPEFIHQYGEFLQRSERTTHHVAPAPSFIRRNHLDVFESLVINWAGVKEGRGGIRVTLCSICSADTGIGKAPRLSAAYGTWVGDVPDCLQGLTLAEEILIGLVFMRGVVIFLDGQGPQSHRQRGFKGHVISIPLHADSTLQALTDLPRSSSELADAIAVVYYSSASARDELRRVVR